MMMEPTFESSIISYILLMSLITSSLTISLLPPPPSLRLPRPNIRDVTDQRGLGRQNQMSSLVLMWPPSLLTILYPDTSGYVLHHPCFCKWKEECPVSSPALISRPGLHSFKTGENNLFWGATGNVSFLFHQLPDVPVWHVLEVRFDFHLWENISDF